MDESEDLPYPLNLPEEERIQVYRTMAYAEKSRISNELTRRHKEKWFAALHREFPNVTPAEFRQIVIDRLLEEGEEERRIAERCRLRHLAREADRPE